MIKNAEYFLEKAKQYLKEQKEEKALYYLNLFDDLVGCDDELYEQFQKQDEEVMKQIDSLCQKTSYLNVFEDWINKKANSLTYKQKLKWVTLSLARMNWIFRKLGTLKGFEVFEAYSSIIGILVEEISKGYHINVKVNLDDFILDVEDIVASDWFSSDNKVELDEFEAYEAKDFIGGGVITDLLLALGSISDFFRDEEEQEFPLKIIAVPLHRGYFARVSELEMQDIPKIQEEKRRIEADFEYIAGEPNTADFYLKVDEYLGFSWISGMKIVNEALEKFQNIQVEICSPLFEMLREINRLERNVGKRGGGIDFKEFEEMYFKIVEKKCTEKLLSKGYGIGVNNPPRYKYIDEECTVIFRMKEVKKAEVEIHFLRGSTECKHRFKFVKEQGLWLINAFDWYTTYDCVWHRGTI